MGRLALANLLITMLFATAPLAKLFFPLYSQPNLSSTNQVLEWFSGGAIAFSTMFLELALVIYLLAGHNNILKVTLVAWFSSIRIIYRFRLWWIALEATCSCLESLTQ